MQGLYFELYAFLVLLIKTFMLARSHKTNHSNLFSKRKMSNDSDINVDSDKVSGV